jgi:hypothetical protein
MSRRRSSRKSWPKREVVVTVVCSDKGQHRPPRVVGRVSHLLRLFACVALGGLILSACYSGNPSGPTVGILGIRSPR